MLVLLGRVYVLKQFTVNYPFQSTQKKHQFQSHGKPCIAIKRIALKHEILSL